MEALMRRIGGPAFRESYASRKSRRGAEKLPEQSELLQWKQLLTKYSKTEVGYRLAAAGANRRCGNYTKHTCTSIEGRVEAGDVCNIWKLNVPLSTSDGLAE